MKRYCIDIIKKYPTYAEKINDKRAFNFLVGETIKEVGPTANIKNIVAEMRVLLNYTVPEKEKPKPIENNIDKKGYYFVINNKPTIFCYSTDYSLNIWDIKNIFNETGKVFDNCWIFDYNTNPDELPEFIHDTLKKVNSDLMIKD
ncbi:MAG: hypothetical protein PHC28_09515 [Flavobacterium sp.]|uniref:hypothetical protein n=1 Tax=Flavobacterium sp. TaxID=239 RepID=UPI00261284B8|nr:hypothetical protein [Flavobacterium sp.]MDD5150694.1 hypothetical protein [Flavobacterium sp.]